MKQLLGALLFVTFGNIAPATAFEWHHKAAEDLDYFLTEESGQLCGVAVHAVKTEGGRDLFFVFEAGNTNTRSSVLVEHFDEWVVNRDMSQVRDSAPLSECVSAFADLSLHEAFTSLDQRPGLALTQDVLDAALAAVEFSNEGEA